MALLYLLALAHGAPLPPRLVYIVDRRAIVDQTAERVEAWVDRLAGIPEAARAIDARAAFPLVAGHRIVPIGVVRGGVADSGEWRIDPARPSVIVGTVDMIGSRLLFSGYGDGRSRRSLHAGLLGYDTTVVLDEAHLSIPLMKLLESIRAIQHDGWRPRFEVLTMSATPASGESATFTDDDREHDGFRRRLQAGKRCSPHCVETAEGKRGGKNAVRSRIIALATRHKAGSILIFVREVDAATTLYKELARKIGDPDRCGLLTGTLRGHERQRLLSTPLWRRFLPDRSRNAAAPPCFLVSTSAGEVGIDIDADHLIMDLAPLDRMVQRLGRVNRGGLVETSEVRIVYAEDDVKLDPGKAPGKMTERERINRARQTTLDVLRELPDVSPESLMSVDAQRRREASTPAPKIATLDRRRVDRMAATSIGERDAAIPLFLRGLDDTPDPPETQVVWRRDVSILWKSARTPDAGEGLVEAALDAFPPIAQEVLKAPTGFVGRELRKLAGRVGPVACIVRDRTGAIRFHTLEADTEPEGLAYGTVFLPAEAGGLTGQGLLDGSAAACVEDLGDDGDRVRFEESEGVPSDGSEVPDWVEGAPCLRIPLGGDGEDGDEEDEGGSERSLVYARRRIGEMTLLSDSDAITRLAARRQTLEEHGEAVGRACEKLAERVGLSPAMIATLREAGAWHDRGKGRAVWQRAAGAWPSETPMAKSKSGTAFRPKLLGGYRHEFGSVADAEDVERGLALPARTPEDDPDAAMLHTLALHLIAAHHGHARPGFPRPEQWDAALPDAEAERIAREVEVRFAACHEHIGPWALAWLESLVKAADARVSSGQPVDAA